MKPSLLFFLITTIPMVDILISFKTNQYPKTILFKTTIGEFFFQDQSISKTMPKTKIGRSIFALVATGAWIIALIFTIIDYF